MGPVFTTNKQDVHRVSLALYHGLLKDLVPLTLGATGAQVLQLAAGTGGWSKPSFNALIYMASSLYNYHYDTQQKMAGRELIIGGGFLEKDFVEVLVDGRRGQSGVEGENDLGSFFPEDVQSRILQGYDHEQPGPSLEFVLQLQQMTNESTLLL